MPALKVLAAFDFDGTLTRGDSLLRFLRRGLGHWGLLRALLQASPWLAGYAFKCVSNEVAKTRLLQVSLGGRSQEEIADWTQRWLAHDLPGQLRPWTQERLAWHQAQGHGCVLVSASPDVYLRAVAEKLGFDGLVCTEMQVQNGVLTGRLQTPNCHGQQKVLRLQQWLAEQKGGADANSCTLYAYGDTPGDYPLLRLAQHAWYRSQPWKDSVDLSAPSK